MPSVQFRLPCGKGSSSSHRRCQFSSTIAERRSCYRGDPEGTHDSRRADDRVAAPRGRRQRPSGVTPRDRRSELRPSSFFWFRGGNFWQEGASFWKREGTFWHALVLFWQELPGVCLTSNHKVSARVRQRDTEMPDQCRNLWRPNQGDDCQRCPLPSISRCFFFSWIARFLLSHFLVAAAASYGFNFFRMT